MRVSRRAVTLGAFAAVLFAGLDWLQGRPAGVGVGTAAVLGAVQAATWMLFAPAALNLGSSYPVTRRALFKPLLVHAAAALAFAVVKTALDFAFAQTLVAGTPPVGPGFTGNAIVYLVLAGAVGRRPTRERAAALE